MLVVVASERDREARAAVEHWGAGAARLLTPQDLSRPGWIYDPASPDDGSAVVSGERVPAQAVSGILTRLPAVFEADLPQIVAADRPYVAAEMTAFLLAWLSSRSCTVVNRPRPSSLAGPAWRPVQWRRAAAEAELTLAPYADGGDGAIPVHEAVVVGSRCLRCGDPRLEEAALRLAAQAGVDFVAVRFREEDGDAVFAGADPWPDPSQPDVAEALHALLSRT